MIICVTLRLTNCDAHSGPPTESRKGFYNMHYPACRSIFIIICITVDILFKQWAIKESFEMHSTSIQTFLQLNG